MAINKRYLTAGRSASSDECLTPRYAVEPIIPYLKSSKFKTVWCPFDTPHSQYVRVLSRKGFKVLHSHIDEGKDFFSYLPDVPYDVIVSNPPFSKKDEVLERVYALGKPFMLLLPQNSLQSQKRVKLFMKHGLQYLGFDKRVCFYTNGELDAWKAGNHFASGYFCSVGVLCLDLEFEVLNPVQEPYFAEGGC